MSELPQDDQSKIFGMSVRGFIAVLLTFTVCEMSILALPVDEPLKSALTFALGFYFGQKK